MTGLSIRARVVLSVSALIGLLCLALVALLPGGLDSVARDGVARQSEAVAHLMAQSLEPAVDFGDPESAGALLGQLEAIPDVNWAVVYLDDEPEPFATYGEGAPLSAPSLVAVVAFEEDQAIASAPVETAFGVQAHVFVGWSLASLEQIKAANQRTAMIAAGVVLVVGVCLAWVLGSVLIGPLQRITDRAKRVTRGDLALDALINERPEGNDEVAVLTRALAELADQVTDNLSRFELEKIRAEAAEADAKHASETKSVFLANMSHELRTPLNAIIGYSEILMEEAEDLGQPESVPDLKRIQSAGKHLLGLINDVLDLAKVEAGRMEVFLESCDVPAVIREVCQAAAPQIDKNGNALDIHLDPSVGTARTDVTKLKQILLNLLSNAAKFTTDGTIAVHARVEQGDEVVIEVRDTGIGMTEEVRAKLFQPFTQADASTTRKYGGTGLGLTLTRQFAELLEGSVTVDSVEGEGSVFTVRIPGAIRPRTPTPQPMEGVSPGAPTVLLVDDDEAAVEVLTRILNRGGYRVVPCAQPGEAMPLVRAHSPVVMLLDLAVADGSGWEVVASLRATETGRPLPVVLVTMEDERARGYELGVADYLAKPVERERLLNVVERFRPDSEHARVLVVEDDPDTARMVQRSLEREGWVVDLAENGRHGLERLDDRVTLVLLDLMMPEMDGFEFLEHLRASDDLPQVPVVVLTAMDMTAEQRARLALGAQQIIQKGGAVLDTHVLTTVRQAARLHADRTPGS